MIRGLTFICAAFLIGGWLSSGGRAAAASAPKPGEIFRDCKDCPEMVVIPAGSNKLGSTAEERAIEGDAEKFAQRELPKHTVTFDKPFALAKFDTTKGLYALFVTETHRPDPDGCGIHDAKTDSWAKQAVGNWHNVGWTQTDNDPAACISWNDAHDFAAWLAKKTGKKYRLPSEAEWEYAARAGTKTIRYWGDSDVEICKYANVMSTGTFAGLGSPASYDNQLMCQTDRAFTTPVGTYPPNPWGLYDMLGNIWQWVADCDHDASIVPTDGKPYVAANCDRHYLKGGAFHSQPYMARPAIRGLVGVPSDAHPAASGFRVARDLD